MVKKNALTLGGYSISKTKLGEAPFHGFLIGQDDHIRFA